MNRRTTRRVAAAGALTLALMGGFTQTAFADPPGPGDKQCVPGQNNVGGGAGNSGPGDQRGAPLKAPPSCPGGGR
jgi:hypothetical protein